MPDKTTCESVRGKFSTPKAVVEQEARDAYAAGLTPNEACPYPFHTDAALHWLATYNLCMPLSAHRQPSLNDNDPHP